MPLLVVKLFENDSPADLKTDAEAYLVAESADGVRGMDGDQFLDHDGDTHAVLAVAHNGIDTPVALTGAAQLIAVDSDQLAKAQAAVEAALADVVHSTVTDGVTTTPGKVTSVSNPFSAEDVGRKVRIAGVEKTITVHNTDGDVDYDNADGDFASGTGLTVDLLGAESMQAGTLSLTSHKAKDRDTVFSVRAMVEGETL
jgi:hypothetical protein